jgi:spermidine synthase
VTGVQTCALPISIYLLGNVIGVWFGSILSKFLKHPAVGFGASLTFLGILGILYIPWLYIWSKLGVTHIVSHLGISHMTNVQWQVTAFTILNCLFLFLLPSITMGIGFPLALQAWSRYRHKVGETTGTVYGINTIGCVVGGVIAGFVFIPFMGVQLSITLFGLAGIWLGSIMMQVYSGRVKIAERMTLTATALVLTIIALMIPSSLFEREFVKMFKTELVEAKEGVTTTVSVHRGVEGDLTLATSGIRVAGDERDAFRIPQKILGNLGLLLNRNPSEAITVGYGSGETVACMSLYELKQLVGVEISPELVELSQKYFRHINLGDQLNEKATMIYMDAKNFVHLTDRHYDLIANDAINPREFAENASLYTKEYFEDALKHLKSGGMFGTYLPVKEMPIPCTNSIL